MVLLADSDAAERLRRLRQHGMAVSAHERHAAQSVIIEQYEELGFNFRMTDIQAAVGLVQLSRLDAIVAERRRLAGLYAAELSAIEGVVAPADPPYGETNYQSYAVRLDPEFPLGRDHLMEHLLSAGISTRRGIMAAHLEPAFATDLPVQLPTTERLTRDSVILPLYHDMGEAGIERVTAAIRSAAARPRP
jgi:perosamine synthetase